MLKLLFILLISNMTLFAGWHSRHNHPKPGQLFMVIMHEKESYFDTTSIVITHYNPDFKKSLPIGGWYDVNKCDVHRWMKKGYKIYIFPRKYRTDIQTPSEWDG